MDMYGYECWFKDYAGRFRQEKIFDQENIDLKVDHSLRVLDEARGITGHESFSDHETWLTHMAALLHDVGRFVQYDTYKTYSDPQSVDHGDLGREVLEKEGVLGDLPKIDQHVILEAVRLHNKKDLPEDITEPLGRVTRAVRDADKLDIVPVVLSRVGPGCPDNPVLRLGLGRDPEKYTQDVFDQVQGLHMVEYQSMRWVNDFKLLLASWSYALNYSWSRKQVLDRNYLDRLFALLPDTPAFGGLYDTLVAHLCIGA
ncbi:MAG: HD domain-containing protein [Desulfoplanes sp.]